MIRIEDNRMAIEKKRISSSLMSDGVEKEKTTVSTDAPSGKKSVKKKSKNLKNPNDLEHLNSNGLSDKPVVKKKKTKVTSTAKKELREKKLRDLNSLSSRLQDAQAEIKHKKQELKGLLEKKIDREKRKSKKWVSGLSAATDGSSSKAGSSNASAEGVAAKDTKSKSKTKTQAIACYKSSEPLVKKRVSKDDSMMPSVKQTEDSGAGNTKTKKHVPRKKKESTIAGKVPGEKPASKDRAPPKKSMPTTKAASKPEKQVTSASHSGAPVKISHAIPKPPLGDLRQKDKELKKVQIDSKPNKKPIFTKPDSFNSVSTTEGDGDDQAAPETPLKRKSNKSFGSKRKVFEHQSSDVPSWAKSPGSKSGTTPSSSPRPRKSIWSSSSLRDTPTSPKAKDSPKSLKNCFLERDASQSPKSLKLSASSLKSAHTPPYQKLKVPPKSTFHESFSVLLPLSPPLTLSLTSAGILATPKPHKNRDASQFASSRNAVIEALTTPARKKKEVLESVTSTPRTLRRGFVALNVATPRKAKPSNSNSPTPPQRFMDASSHGRDKAQSYVESALGKIVDKSKKKEVEELVRKIESLGGFPHTRRLSMRDNELVGRLVMAVRNDPRITKVHVDSSVFGTISSTLLAQFIDALRVNLHVKSLSFRGVELGNDFLYALAASMESNFVVEEIDLSMNCFTNEGLANFCEALASNNESLKSLNLKNQTTPISEASEVDVMEAFDQNKNLTNVQLDFMSEDGPEKLKSLMERNQVMGSDKIKNVDEKLIGVLTYEAERAQEAWDQQQAEANLTEVDEEDWTYLYELAVLFDRHKLKKEVEENAKETFVPATEKKNADGLSAAEKKIFLFGQFQKNMEESVMAFNSNGSFLTPEFIAKYFKELAEENALNFDFHGQWKLFKRFPVHDPDRQLIVDKFVDAIVSHPRAKEITGINMANTGAGDDFLIALSDRCIANDSLLPNLHTVNFETNFINEHGVTALAHLVAHPTSCKYMQVIRLENQKGMMKSKAEFALAKSMRVNRSIVVVSLTIRNLLEKERINKYVMRNVDLIRQARQQHAKATGTQRKRNKVEQVFDEVRLNTSRITVVNMMGNERFLTLTPEEKCKAASSFAKNTHVTEILLNGCGIDDAFAKALGESFKTNTTVGKVCLESNDISGEGIKALFEGLGGNSSIMELRLHKQSKLLASADEDTLTDFLESNTTITKLGIDTRSKMVKVQLDRKTAHNINLELKQKAEAKGGDFSAVESYQVMKF